MGLGLIVIRKKEDLVVGLRAIIHVLNHQISHLREAIIHALNQMSHLREARWKELILIRMKREKIL